jgi:hypothetical protein
LCNRYPIALCSPAAAIALQPDSLLLDIKLQLKSIQVCLLYWRWVAGVHDLLNQQRYFWQLADAGGRCRARTKTVKTVKTDSVCSQQSAKVTNSAGVVPMQCLVTVKLVSHHYVMALQYNCRKAWAHHSFDSV